MKKTIARFTVRITQDSRIVDQNGKVLQVITEVVCPSLERLVPAGQNRDAVGDIKEAILVLWEQQAQGLG